MMVMIKNYIYIELKPVLRSAQCPLQSAYNITFKTRIPYI